MDEQVETEES